MFLALFLITETKKMSDQMQHHSPAGVICTVISWLTVTLAITLEDIDVYLRIFGSLVAIVTGIFALVNWYWAIKKNKKLAKRDIPF